MIRPVQVALLGIAIVGSCGGDSSVCGPRTGSYRVTYTEKKGTCGPIAEAVILAESTMGQTHPWIRWQIDGDECEMVDESSSSGTTAGGSEKVETRATINWSASGATGTADLVITVTGTSKACTSTYAVSFTRI